MCYTGKCEHEDHMGECRKPKKIPVCPDYMEIMMKGEEVSVVNFSDCDKDTHKPEPDYVFVAPKF